MPGAAAEADDAALDALDRRLSPASAAAIGVAFSGGGDSLMALRASLAWARRHGRRVIAFHVDHGLQTPSADWALAARQAAERLGATFVGLRWTGAKPSNGLAAAARDARHRLIAEAARAAGARVLVLGHTADDRIEAVLMREAGVRMGELGEWSPSPVWPEGRGLFHLRPLLGLRRAAIRQTLDAAGETWIDDPANVDVRSPRAQVRLAAAKRAPPPSPPDFHSLGALAARAVVGPGGDIRIDRRLLRAAPDLLVQRLVSAAAVCAGGQSGPPRAARAQALSVRLQGDADLVASLSGARIVATDWITVSRNAGEAARGGLTRIALAAGETGVWDGRFEITAGAAPVTIDRLAGQAAALPQGERAALKRLPATVRPGLPVLVKPGAAPSCPILAEASPIEARLLVAERFAAACGVISKEPAA